MLHFSPENIWKIDPKFYGNLTPVDPAGVTSNVAYVISSKRRSFDPENFSGQYNDSAACSVREI